MLPVVEFTQQREVDLLSVGCDLVVNGLGKPAPCLVQVLQELLLLLEAVKSGAQGLVMIKDFAQILGVFHAHSQQVLLSERVLDRNRVFSRKWLLRSGFGWRNDSSKVNSFVDGDL